MLLVGVPLQVLEVLVQEPDSQLLRVVMHDIDLINPTVRVFLRYPHLSAFTSHVGIIFNASCSPRAS